MDYITKINPWKTAFFISIFELFTFGILPYFKLNTVLTGLIVGFVGGFIAILLFNFISSKGFKLNVWFDGKQVVLKRLDLIIPSLANAVFLMLLFLVQLGLVFEFRSELVNDALTGFLSTFIAMIGCIILYNFLIKFLDIGIKGITSDFKFEVMKIDITRSCFFVALFELFILPFMGLFLIIFQNIPFYIKFPLVGLFSGFLGSFIASFCYNLLARFFKGIGMQLKL